MEIPENYLTKLKKLEEDVKKRDEEDKERAKTDTEIKMRFDPVVAKKVGVEEAIMYSNIRYWCIKNKANKKHFNDGRFWTYNSIEAFCDLFPFWTEKQIRRILNNLIKKGYVKTGNYNKKGYDRTKWYACI